MTPWTVAHQAPLSMNFSRQEYWTGLPCRPPGYLPNPGIKPRFPALQADSLLSEPSGKPQRTALRGKKRKWVTPNPELPSWFSGKESACQCRKRRFNLVWEDPLEKEMATHSSILAWKISRTEEPGGLRSMGSQRIRQD